MRSFPVWGAILWGVAVVVASLGMWLHAASPGKAAGAPERWPEGSVLVHDPELLTLLVFAHPACACTKATMEELARLLDARADRVRVQVFFESYEGVNQAPSESRAWAAASALPHASVDVDVDGAEAARFGVLTSGRVLAYDPSGALRFAGGVTRGRGERGDNNGAVRLARLIDEKAALDVQSPVYGCSLLSPEGVDVYRTTN